MRQGDWESVARLTDRVARDRAAGTPDALGERLRRLRRVLVAARVARAHLGDSLARVRAAARFINGRG